MKMVSSAILATPLIVLTGTAIAAVTPAGVAGLGNPGAHGFGEMLSAFSSAANNNGSAFGGLAANTTFYNTSLAVAMWFGRFTIIVPVLAIAGSLAWKKRRGPGAGTLPTHGPPAMTPHGGGRLAVRPSSRESPCRFRRTASPRSPSRNRRRRSGA